MWKLFFGAMFFSSMIGGNTPVHEGLYPTLSYIASLLAVSVFFVILVTHAAREFQSAFNGSEGIFDRILRWFDWVYGTVFPQHARPYLLRRERYYFRAYVFMVHRVGPEELRSINLASWVGLSGFYIGGFGFGYSLVYPHSFSLMLITGLALGLTIMCAAHVSAANKALKERYREQYEAEFEEYRADRAGYFQRYSIQQDPA